MSETTQDDLDIVARADHPGLNDEQFRRLCFNAQAFAISFHPPVDDPRRFAMTHLMAAAMSGDDDATLAATVRELVKHIARIEAAS